MNVTSKRLNFECSQSQGENRNWADASTSWRRPQKAEDFPRNHYQLTVPRICFADSSQLFKRSITGKFKWKEFVLISKKLGPDIFIFYPMSAMKFLSLGGVQTNRGLNAG